MNSANFRTLNNSPIKHQLSPEKLIENSRTFKTHVRSSRLNHTDEEFIKANTETIKKLDQAIQLALKDEHVSPKSIARVLQGLDNAADAGKCGDVKEIIAGMTIQNRLTITRIFREVLRTSVNEDRGSLFGIREESDKTIEKLSIICNAILLSGKQGGNNPHIEATNQSPANTESIYFNFGPEQKRPKSQPDLKMEEDGSNALMRQPDKEIFIANSNNTIEHSIATVKMLQKRLNLLELDKEALDNFINDPNNTDKKNPFLENLNKSKNKQDMAERIDFYQNLCKSTYIPERIAEIDLIKSQLQDLDLNSVHGTEIYHLEHAINLIQSESKKYTIPEILKCLLEIAGNEKNSIPPMGQAFSNLICDDLKNGQKADQLGLTSSCYKLINALFIMHEGEAAFVKSDGQQKLNSALRNDGLKGLSDSTLKNKEELIAGLNKADKSADEVIILIDKTIIFGKTHYAVHAPIADLIKNNYYAVNSAIDEAQQVAGDDLKISAANNKAGDTLKFKPIKNWVGTITNYKAKYIYNGEEIKIVVGNPTQEVIGGSAGGFKKLIAKSAKWVKLGLIGEKKPAKLPLSKLVHLTGLKYIVPQYEVEAGVYVSENLGLDLRELRSKKNYQPITTSQFKSLILNLEVLHAKGLVHQDIKLANLFLKNGEVYLSDLDGLHKVGDGLENRVATFVGPVSMVIHSKVNEWGSIIDRLLILQVLIEASYKDKNWGNPGCAYSDPDPRQLTDEDKITWIEKNIKAEYVDDLKEFIKQPFAYIENFAQVGDPEKALPKLSEMLIFEDNPG